jgi:methionine-rich copper-binding protein CopC
MTSVPKSISILATILFITPLAWAHARPKTMIPAADSAGPAPTKIIVTFSEPVEAKFSSLTVTDEKGVSISKQHSLAEEKDPKTLTLALPSLVPGDYLVHWVSIAPDGHRMEGKYKFIVK